MADQPRIEQIAPIIERYTSDVPVRVEAIARDLGMSVVQDVIDPNIAGKIVKDDRNPAGYAIYLNARDSGRRQRFTLAHEIAHFVLHRDLIGDGVIDDAMYRSKLGDWYERQANRWAADLLMPAALVRGLYRGGMTASTALADALNVSQEAVRIRLSELGFMPRDI